MIQRLLVQEVWSADHRYFRLHNQILSSGPVQPASSGQFADDSNEGGVLVLESLVVGTEVPQNLESRGERR